MQLFDELAASVALNQTHAVETFVAPRLLEYWRLNIWVDPAPETGVAPSAVRTAGGMMVHTKDRWLLRVPSDTMMSTV
jgi:hypothetical protein